MLEREKSEMRELQKKCSYLCCSLGHIEMMHFTICGIQLQCNVMCGYFQ